MKSLLESVTAIKLLLALFFRVFALIGAPKKFAVEQLNSNDSENKLKQYVHN